MKTTVYTITPAPRVTLVGMGSAYMGTFAGLWLVIEPLGAFGLIPAPSKLSGFALYSLLLVIPALALPALIRWHRWYKTHDLPFVSFTVRSAADGITYSLRVAENMQISDFLQHYTKILLKGPAHSQVAATLHRYYPILQSNKNGSLVDFDGSLTLRDAGIAEGEEYVVRAQEYEYLSRVMFSRRLKNDA